MNNEFVRRMSRLPKRRASDCSEKPAGLPLPIAIPIAIGIGSGIVGGRGLAAKSAVPQWDAAKDVKLCCGMPQKRKLLR